jgi:hypothetical protein
VYCIGGIKYQNGATVKDKKDMCKKLFFTHNNIKSEGDQLIEEACKIIKDIVRKTEDKSGTVIFIQNYGLVEAIASVLGKKLEGIPIFYDAVDKNVNAF